MNMFCVSYNHKVTELLHSAIKCLTVFVRLYVKSFCEHSHVCVDA